MTAIKRTLAFFLTLLLSLSLAACSGPGDGASSGPGPAKVDYPVEVGGVTLRQSPAKVAVLSPSLADIVVALGSAYQLKLAARAEDCTQPELETLPTAGTAAAPDVQAILASGAELLLTDVPLSDAANGELAQKGVSVAVLPPAEGREALTVLYTAVASALMGGKTGYEAGLKRAQDLFYSLDDLLRLVPEEEKSYTACYLVDAQGAAAAADSYVGSLIEYAGAINVVAEGGQTSLSQEEWETANPSFIFCAEGTKDAILKSAVFQGLNAVQDGKVYELPVRLTGRQGATMLEAVIKIAGILHPSMKGNASDEPDNENNSSSAGHPDSVGEGSSREDILVLQERLIELGYMQPPGDGTYGYWTKMTVKEFQRRAGLEETGLADKQTMEKLFAEDAPKG